MKAARIIVMTVFATWLAGCSLLIGHRDEVTLYAPALEWKAQSSMKQGSHAWQLAVAQPHAIAPLDGDHILVVPIPGEIEYYRGARWRDAAPAMLQELLVRAFHDLAGLTGTAAPGSGVRADYLLRSDLHDFQAEYRGAATPTVVVRLTFQLVRNSDGTVVGGRTFEVEEPCRTVRISDVFTAFQSAIIKIAFDVVEWSIAEGDRQS